MADFNKLQSSCDQATVSSSYFEIAEPESIITDSMSSSSGAVGKPLDFGSDVRTDGPQSTEELVCPKPISFTSLCLTCLFRNNKIAATHFCYGCDEHGRYMCDKCLREHNIWCRGPEHVLNSLSVDRHRSEYDYRTVEPTMGVMQKNRSFPGNKMVQKWLKDGTEEEPKHTTTGLTNAHYVDNYIDGCPSTESHEPYDRINHHAVDDFDSQLEERIYHDYSAVTESSPWVLREKSYTNLIKRSTNINEAYSRPGTTSHIYNWPFEEAKSNRTISDSFDWGSEDTDTLKRLDNIYKEKEHKKKSCIIS